MTAQRFRLAWLVLHRWIGLTCGLLLLVSGLSGSLLVFQHEIDEWLNPNLLKVDQSDGRRPLNEVIESAERYHKDNSSRLSFIDFPQHKNAVWVAWYSRKRDGESRFNHVYVDPSTAEVTGHRIVGSDPMSWIHRLHVELLAGKTGETIVGSLGIILVASVCSGILLWWPLWKNSWRAAFVIRNDKRLIYDLHKTVGILGAVFLLISSCTGVYLVFPNWIKPCVTMISKETRPPKAARQSETSAKQKPIDVNQVVAIAKNVFPDGQLKRLQFPTGPEGVYIVRIRRAGDVRRSSGNSRLWINQYTGSVQAVRDWNRRTLADTILGWQFPLHNGEAFQLTGRWIVFLTGLLPAFLFVTGFLLWWRRKRMRNRRKRPVVS